MNETSPDPAATENGPRGTPGRENRWAVVALFSSPCVVLAGIVILGLCLRNVGLMTRALVLLMVFLPGFIGLVLETFVGRWPGDYPPVAAGEHAGERWILEPPGVPFVFPFSMTLLAFPLGGAVLATAAARSGLELMPGLLLTQLPLAIGFGFLFRSRPRLEVDEVRQELVWHPGTRFGTAMTFPFAAIADVRVEETTAGRNPAYSPEIEWWSNKRRSRTTQLPRCLDRSQVEAVVARLQAAVFGAATPTTSPAGSR